MKQNKKWHLQGICSKKEDFVKKTLLAEVLKQVNIRLGRRLCQRENLSYLQQPPGLADITYGGEGAGRLWGVEWLLPPSGKENTGIPLP